MTSGPPDQKQPYHHGDLRNALVQAAVELAREGRGPQAIALREVARRVGVSATAAYRHFSALPELVDEVVAVAFSRLAGSMEAELDRCVRTGDPRVDSWAEMRATGRGYVHFSLEEPGLFAVAFNRVGPTTRAGQGAGDLGLTPRELLERSLDRMVAAGVLSPDDRVAASSAAWSIVHGLSLLLVSRMGDLPPDQRESVIESTLDLMGRGLIVRN